MSGPRPIGHRIAPALRYAHIMRVYDGGVVRGQRRDGYFIFASTLHEGSICHRVLGGAMRSRDPLGTEEGAARIHAHRVEAAANGHPTLEAPARLLECPRCFAVYRAEPTEDEVRRFEREYVALKSTDSQRLLSDLQEHGYPTGSEVGP